MIPAFWPLGVLIYLAIYWFNSNHISEMFEKTDNVRTDFGKFSRVLEYLESYKYKKGSILSEFCRIYFNSEKSPSTYFKKLSRITTAVSIQKNPFVMLLVNAVFPYAFYFALKLEKIKSELKEILPLWLEKFYTLESLNSLANFAYINPDYVFPEISHEQNTLIKADNLKHPFIHHSRNIPNDIKILESENVLIITGSNMSGKSTFLKSVGVNFVLAFAGGVVAASKFESKIFRLFSCISINDSIIDGISYFYAEVKRLKNLLNEIKTDNSLSVFYLIDEIFRGTNNLERLIGSRSYIKVVAELKAAGLISTHDLELIKLEKEINKVVNYHFKEDIFDGKMIFDYKLRKGPSPSTNALKIMELEGLPVVRDK
jgi:DNA mismatch repair ATPase MutS